MDNFKAYLWRIFPVSLTVIITTTVFFICGTLVESANQVTKLGSELVITLWFFYCLISYRNNIKSRNIEEENQELQREILNLKNSIIDNRKEMEEYFLLWIHQMKTPITAAKLIAKEQRSKITNKEQESAIRSIDKELISIENYTNMALTYLKIADKNADMVIGEVRLDDMIKPIIRRYASLFIEKKISMSVETDDAVVITDGRWCSLLLEQLISNSIKYTDSGAVTIKFNKKTNSLDILDTGIGIDKADLPKIFDKGYSGLNGRFNEKSSGLGLFLANRIAEKLGISIKVESEIGLGSKFSLEFPKNK